MEQQEYERLKFIAETHRKALDTRRDYEWKTLTMTVAFYVLASAAAYAGDFAVPDLRYAIQIAWAVSIALSILSVSYLLMLHRANDDNKSIAEAAENAIIDAVGNEGVKTARNAANARRTAKPKSMLQMPTFVRRRWSFIWQAMAILSFAVVATHLTLVAPTTVHPKSASK